MRIVIYSKSGCQNCLTAKSLLKSKGLQYDEYWIDANHVAEEKMKAANIKQMPAIYINDQFVGGLAGLQAALKQAGL
jgi:glutaredoxin 3